MTVKHIDTEALQKIIDDDDVDTNIMSIRLTETELQAVPKETWRFVKDQLKNLDDMTHTCTTYTRMGIPVKKFIFTCSNREHVIQAVNFIDTIVCQLHISPVAEVSSTFRGGLPGSMEGADASCPLFS